VKTRPAGPTSRAAATLNAPSPAPSSQTVIPGRNAIASKIRSSAIVDSAARCGQTETGTSSVTTRRTAGRKCVAMVLY
jgi:hypothetical protein